MESRIALLKSVPGVGQVIAMTLMATLPELGAVSDKRISALVGVAPFIEIVTSFEAVG